jgi:hypothetical protein
MEKHNIIIFAVNQHVIDYFLFPWLSQKESKNYKLYIVTNEFEYLNISQKLKGRDYELIDYFGPRFNYYDKFIIGTGIINKIKQPSFIWDVDELSVFHHSVHLYDTSIDVVQAGRRYYKDATLGDERNADGFLLTYFARDLGIDPKTVAAIQEDKLWFPYIDYTQFQYILQKCKYKQYAHEGKHYSKWYVDGIGEGNGVGLALTKSKIPYRFVGEYLI